MSDKFKLQELRIFADGLETENRRLEERIAELEASNADFRFMRDKDAGRIAELEEGLRQYADLFPKPNIASELLANLEAHNRGLKQRIAELEHNWQMEGNFSRAIIDARDQRIVELEECLSGMCALLNLIHTGDYPIAAEILWRLTAAEALLANESKP